MELTVIVLVGGRGTRIAHLRADTPKPLVAVNGRPFLDWLTLYLLRFGLRRLVYSAGYKAEQVEAWIAHFKAVETTDGVCLAMVREDAPLGTGGAIFACLDACGDWFLALNGDSLALCDLQALTVLAEYEGLDGALIGLPVPDTSRYGSLDVDPRGLLRGFHEKRPGSGLINAGIYLLRKAAVEPLRRDGQVSIETELLPEMLAAGRRIRVIEASKVPFIDIGTPETLAASDAFVATHRRLFDRRDQTLP